jgi:hypothetical protein
MITIHSVLVSDGFVHECYTYDFDQNDKSVLNKHVYPIESSDWDFKMGDLDSTQAYVVKYRLNKEGRIIEEVDSIHNCIVKYLYSAGLLVEKQVVRGRRTTETWTYQYLDGKLKQADFKVDTEVINYYFSSDGRLLYSKATDIGGTPHFSKYFFSYKDSTNSLKLK